jgi:hypothetical protein
VLRGSANASCLATGSGHRCQGRSIPLRGGIGKHPKLLLDSRPIPGGAWPGNWPARQFCDGLAEPTAARNRSHTEKLWQMERDVVGDEGIPSWLWEEGFSGANRVLPHSTARGVTCHPYSRRECAVFSGLFAVTC